MARDSVTPSLRDFLYTRAVMYDLLARLYTYPLGSAAVDAVAALRVENAPAALSDALAMMHACIASASERGEFVEALNVQATPLFEGPGQPAAPPYASFYLNEGQLMGPAALAARRAYLAWNLRPRDGRVPPDHLALELGFMAHLAGKATEANDGELTNALAGSATFLREHLLTWVPKFGVMILAATHHSFYVGLANLTCVLLQSDEELLGQILESQPHLNANKTKAEN